MRKRTIKGMVRWLNGEIINEPYRNPRKWLIAIRDQLLAEQVGPHGGGAKIKGMVRWLNGEIINDPYDDARKWLIAIRDQILAQQAGPLPLDKIPSGWRLYTLCDRKSQIDSFLCRLRIGDDEDSDTDACGDSPEEAMYAAIAKVKANL